MLTDLFLAQRLMEERVKEAKSDSDSGPGKRNSEGHGTE